MTLVVGYDGSSGAQATLTEAVALAQSLGDGLHVVFSAEPDRPSRPWA